MKQLIILFVSLTFLSASCKKEDPVITPGADITLSSKTFGETVYYSFGYSFELQKFIKTINSPDVIDIYLIKYITISGKLTGIQFATKEVPESTYGFYRNNSFTNSAEAGQFYENYITAEAPQFTILTDTVNANQIWTFKTFKKNYVKILVKDVRKVYNGDNVDYIEVDIKYFIQRDGSLKLTE